MPPLSSHYDTKPKNMQYACQKFTILLAIIFMNAYIIITFIQRYIKYIKSKLMSYLNNNIHIYICIYMN